MCIFKKKGQWLLVTINIINIAKVHLEIYKTQLDDSFIQDRDYKWIKATPPYILMYLTYSPSLPLYLQTPPIPLSLLKQLKNLKKKI